MIIYDECCPLEPVNEPHSDDSPAHTCCHVNLSFLIVIIIIKVAKQLEVLLSNFEVITPGSVISTLNEGPVLQ